MVTKLKFLTATTSACILANVLAIAALIFGAVINHRMTIAQKDNEAAKDEIKTTKLLWASYVRAQAETIWDLEQRVKQLGKLAPTPLSSEQTTERQAARKALEQVGADQLERKNTPTTPSTPTPVAKP